MDYSILKKIFKKKESFKNMTSDITTIDTSFISVPKLSELSEEDRKKVLEYQNKLTLDNKNILKLNDDLNYATNKERSILSRTIERYYTLDKYNKNPLFLRSEQTKAAYCVTHSLLANEEFNIIKRNIINIKKELELRLIAIDLFIKKEEKVKYDPLGILANAENLKTSIKNNINILSTIENDINKNEIVKKGHKILNNAEKKYAKKENDYYYEPFETTTRSTLGYRMDSIRYKVYSYDLYKEFDRKIIDFARSLKGLTSPKDDIIDDEKIKDVIHSGIECYEDNDWRDLVYMTPKDKIPELYSTVANFSRYIEEFTFEHRNDYQKYLSEMNDIIRKYESTPSKDWDKDELEINIEEYAEKLKEYIEICDNYLTEDNINKLKYTFYKMMFLYDLAYRKEYYDSINNALDYNRKTYWDNLDDKVEYEKYCNHLSDELLKKIEDKYGVKYGCEFTNSKKQIKNIRDKFVSDMIDYKYYSLYDMLSDNLDSFDVYFKTIQVENFHEKGVNKLDLNYFLKQIVESKRTILSFYTDKLGFYYYINSNDDKIPFEDIFYTLKLLNLDFYSIDNSLPLDMDTSNDHFVGGDFTIFVSKIKQRQLEDNYDNRILVIPKTISFYDKEGPNFEKSIHNINNLVTNDNIKAIYLSTIEQLEQLSDRLNDLSSVKYIFVKESILEEYKSELKKEVMPNNYLIEIVSVSDDTKYSDLSNYLDLELQKNDKKILRKKSIASM